MRPALISLSLALVACGGGGVYREQNPSNAVDAGTEADAGETADAGGVEHDAGLAKDAGTKPRDAGPPPDAGHPNADGGTADAGSPLDAGEPSDAGGQVDAGQVDAGAACSAANCASGCCSASATCEPGTSVTMCGKAGAACTACGAADLCLAQTCAPSAPTQWVVQVATAKIATDNQGSSWDTGGGAPDMYVRLWCPTSASGYTESDYVGDSYTPAWSHTGHCTISNADLTQGGFAFSAYDYDGVGDDPIVGKTPVMPSPSDLAAGELVLTNQGQLLSITLKFTPK